MGCAYTLITAGALWLAKRAVHHIEKRCREGVRVVESSMTATSQSASSPSPSSSSTPTQRVKEEEESFETAAKIV